MNSPFLDLMPGDRVVRNMAGVEITLTVTEVRPKILVCGLWTFCRETGCEIDEDLGWGPESGVSGSYLEPGRFTKRGRGDAESDAARSGV